MVGDQEKHEDTASDLFVDPLGGMAETDTSAIPIDAPSELAGDLGINLEAEGASEPADLGTGTIEIAVADVGATIAAAMPETPIPGVDSEAAEPSLVSESEGGRFFEITLRGLRHAKAREEALAILKKFPANPVTPEMETRIHELGAHRLTRISEYHAYALAVQLHRAGLDFQIGISGSTEALAESDLVPELKNEAPVTSEGAQAVPLPANPQEILLATHTELSGYRAALNKGVVTAHSAIARAFFREEERQDRLNNKIQALQPGAQPQKRLDLPRAEVDKVFQALLERLQREAFRRGANGVIGIQISGFSESASFNPEADQIRLIASGTAVLLEPK